MSQNIFFTSDLHFCHDREFLYKPRGFDNINQHDQTIIDNWNDIVDDNDLVYVLGDLMLNDNILGCEYFNSLKGYKHIILGNHDTDTRINLYSDIKKVIGIDYATIIKYGKFKFYLSHYPTITSNVDEAHLSQHLFNLYGHTHQKTNFWNDIPWIYHVGLDSHNCTPVHIDQIIEDCKAKYKECGDML